MPLLEIVLQGRAYQRFLHSKKENKQVNPIKPSVAGKLTRKLSFFTDATR
jgi:hypothetical protein